VRSAAPPVRRTPALRLFSSCAATSTATFGRASKFAPTTPIGIRRSETFEAVRQPPAVDLALERRQLRHHEHLLAHRLEPGLVEVQPVEGAGVEHVLGGCRVGPVGGENDLAPLGEQLRRTPERARDAVVGQPCERGRRRPGLALDELEHRGRVSHGRA
jgi:hypothetical protein